MPTLSECKKYYINMNGACSKIIEASFSSSTADRYCNCHNFCTDLEKWIGLQKSRPEIEVIKAALKEYQYSLFAVVQGQYRQAFMALRLSFELALASVHFSANEFELRVWMQGRRDINWQTLMNVEKGVLSTNFIRAFNPAMAEDAAQFRAIAEKVYRECSEYVHGNVHTHKTSSGKIEFIEEAFSDWHKKTEDIKLCIVFALSARYLSLYPIRVRKEVESIVMDTLGHLDSIRELFSE